MKRRRFRTEEGLTMTECNWCKDEICVNADCPICCDYCPVPDTEGVCKFEDRGKRHFTVHEYIVEVLQQMETAMGRLGGTRAEIWQNDIIYCLCRAVWLLMTWELKKL